MLLLLLAWRWQLAQRSKLARRSKTDLIPLWIQFLWINCLTVRLYSRKSLANPLKKVSIHCAATEDSSLESRSLLRELSVFLLPPSFGLTLCGHVTRWRMRRHFSFKKNQATGVLWVLPAVIEFDKRSLRDWCLRRTVKRNVCDPSHWVT